MPRQAQTIALRGFRGLNDSLVPGENAQFTPDLRNVKVRFGVVSGRGGLTNYKTGTDSSAEIIGLFPFNRSNAASNVLTRMLPTKFEELVGTTWTDRTGTALTGTASTRPQFAVIDDTLVFTNEGEDLPRKWTGSGNSANIASGTSPYAKTVESYLGFLMLGNVSTSGAFTDIVDGYRTIRYSDDWDNDWTTCAGNFILLNETPGDLIAMKVLGRSLICYKTDGLVKVRWTGGSIRFQQEKLHLDVGCVAPLSVAEVANTGHIFLATDGLLYLVSESGVKALSDEQLAQTLPTTRSLLRMKFARAFVLEEQDLYVLLYDRTGLSGQLLDSYVAVNYRTGEFVKGRLGVNSIACASFRPTFQDPEVGLISTATDVNQFDLGADDTGTTIDRYWTSGWQPIGGPGDGYFFGARLLFKKSKDARVRVSVARDLDPTYDFPQSFTLKSDDINSETVELLYRVPPILGSWFNVKVQLYHDSTSASTELRQIAFEASPRHPTQERPQAEVSAQRIN